MPKQPVPYYIESYPVYPTFYFDESLCLSRVEKFLIDPMDTLPRKVVLQFTFGENSIQELEDYPTLFTTGKTPNKISPYKLLELFYSIHNGEDEIRSLVDDLKWWGITQVSNDISNETIDIDTFSQNVCDFCQKEEDLDSRWYYSNNVLAQFFDSNDSSDNSSIEENIPETPVQITKEYERLGFPTMGFGDIPLGEQSRLVEALYIQLCSYISNTLEEFKYLLLPSYKYEFNYQPRIIWHTSTKQFMRAVFKYLFPEDVYKKNDCYCYIKEKGAAPISIRLNNNLEKISQTDEIKVKGIISNCYKAVGLQQPITKLSTDKK